MTDGIGTEFDFEVFENQGWELIPSFLTPEEVSQLKKAVDHVATSTTKNEHGILTYYEDDKDPARLFRIERLWEEIDLLNGGPIGQRVQSLAVQCLRESSLLFKDKLNFRYLGTPGYAPHQDTAAGWLDFGHSFVSICIFLEPSSPETGGFEIANGAHRVGRFPNRVGKMEQADFENLDVSAIRANAGDALIIDGETPHRTLDNIHCELTRHLIVTFVSSKMSDPRGGYYAQKKKNFDRHRSGGMTFKVFE